MIPAFLNKLATVASSPFSFVAYIVLVVSWVYITTVRSRLRHDAKMVVTLPTSERLEYLKRQYNAQPRTGLSAEQYIRDRRQNLIFFGVISVLICVTAIITISITETVISQKKVEEIDDRTREAAERLASLQTQLEQANAKLRLDQEALTRRQQLARWSLMRPDGMTATTPDGTGWIGSNSSSVENRTFALIDGKWRWPCISQDLLDYSRIHPDLLYGRVALAQCRLLEGAPNWDADLAEVTQLANDWRGVDPRLQDYDDFALFYQKFTRLRHVEPQSAPAYVDTIYPKLLPAISYKSDGSFLQTLGFYEFVGSGYEISRDNAVQKLNFRVAMLPIDFGCRIYLGQVKRNIGSSFKLLRVCSNTSMRQDFRVDAEIDLAESEMQDALSDITSRLNDPDYKSQEHHALAIEKVDRDMHQ